MLGYTVADNYQEKGKSWNKSTKEFCFKTSKILYLNDETEEEVKKCWMKNDKKNSFKSSTLSLHIAAYENSVEVDSNEVYDLPKKTGAFKHIDSLIKLQSLRDSFEFPRQMDGNEQTAPEVQQFTTSQKLFAPVQDKQSRKKQLKHNPSGRLLRSHCQNNVQPISSPSIPALTQNELYHELRRLELGDNNNPAITKILFENDYIDHQDILGLEFILQILYSSTFKSCTLFDIKKHIIKRLYGPVNSGAQQIPELKRKLQEITSNEFQYSRKRSFNYVHYNEQFSDVLIYNIAEKFLTTTSYDIDIDFNFNFQRNLIRTNYLNSVDHMMEDEVSNDDNMDELSCMLDQSHISEGGGNSIHSKQGAPSCEMSRGGGNMLPLKEQQKIRIELHLAPRTQSLQTSRTSINRTYTTSSRDPQSTAPTTEDAILKKKKDDSNVKRSQASLKESDEFLEYIQKNHNLDAAQPADTLEPKISRKNHHNWDAAQPADTLEPKISRKNHHNLDAAQPADTLEPKISRKNHHNWDAAQPADTLEPKISRKNHHNLDAAQPADTLEPKISRKNHHNWDAAQPADTLEPKISRKNHHNWDAAQPADTLEPKISRKNHHNWDAAQPADTLEPKISRKNHHNWDAAQPADTLEPKISRKNHHNWDAAQPADTLEPKISRKNHNLDAAQPADTLEPKISRKNHHNWDAAQTIEDLIDFAPSKNRRHTDSFGQIDDIFRPSTRPASSQRQHQSTQQNLFTKPMPKSPILYSLSPEEWYRRQLFASPFTFAPPLTSTGKEPLRPVPRKATIADDPLSVLREMYQDPGPIDAKCSQKADNMQEPKPIGDDCPKAESCTAGSLLASLDNEVVRSSQKDDDYLYQNDGISYEPILKNEVVPSSQPDEDFTMTKREQLLTSSNTPSSSSKGQIQIIDDTERHASFAPRPSPRRILRINDTLVPYQTTPTKQSIHRSNEKQDGSDNIVEAPASRKPERTLTSNRSTSVPKNIPELPDDFEMLLENVNFQTKGRKQCDETFGEMSIKGYDLYSLRARQYVNDLIIDKYMELVCSRSTDSGNNYRKSFAFGTFFYTMLNNGQDPNKLVSWIKEDLFDYELLFFPINQENHWYLFVADTVNRNHFVYDSLYYGGNDTEIDQIVDFLKFYAKKKNHDIDWDDWSKNPVEEQIGPKQTNGVDCGIFLCQYAEHLSRRANLDFTQSGMVNYRKIMLYELIKGQLTPRLNKEEKAIEQNDA